MDLSLSRKRDYRHTAYEQKTQWSFKIGLGGYNLVNCVIAWIINS